jgi:hypothetical protein
MDAKPRRIYLRLPKRSSIGPIPRRKLPQSLLPFEYTLHILTLPSTWILIRRHPHLIHLKALCLLHTLIPSMTQTRFKQLVLREQMLYPSPSFLLIPTERRSAVRIHTPFPHLPHLFLFALPVLRNSTLILTMSTFPTKIFRQGMGIRSPLVLEYPAFRRGILICRVPAILAIS